MAKFGDMRPRTYLKASDLKNGDKVFFVDGGQWVQKDFSKEKDGSEKKTVYVAKVRVNSGDDKELTINATSGKSLAEKWGPEGKNWTGQTARVSFIKMLSFGEMKDVLMLIPEGEEE